MSEIWVKALTIVAAPSGYGKTTLLRNYLQKFPHITPFWLSFGHEEVDEVWVWKRLCDRFRDQSEAFAERLQAIGLPQNAQEMDYFVALVRKYLAGPVCVVLDDFQECESMALNKVLTRLAYEEIGNLHIVLITRVYPELPYEEMFLRGYCITVDQSMLSLNREETNEIFRINGVMLEEKYLDEIYKYTDGWISAVYLALFEYQRAGRIGRFSSISHLLKTAIYDKLTPAIQDLYRKMSLFESFTLEQAVYVSECAIHPMALLDAMEQYGFMQFDVLSKHYEMHALMKKVAAEELERIQADKKRLYDRNGEWCEKNESYVQAIVSYRDAGNQKAVFRLLSGEMRSAIFEEAPGIIGDIFEETPFEVKAQYPAAWLGYIYNAIIKMDVEWGKRLFEEARGIYRQMYHLDTEHPELKAELLIIRSLLEFNDLEKINTSLKEAYELLGHKSSRIFRQTLLTYGTPFMTLLYYNKSGGLKRVVELEKEYAQFHMRLVGGGDGGWDDLFDAEYAFLTGDMEKTYRLAVQVGQKAVVRRQVCIIISSYYLQLRSLIYMGEEREFEQKMSEFLRLVKGVSRPVLIVDTQIAYSYVYASLGRKDMVAEWIQNFELEDCSRVVRSTRSACIIYGMLLCKTGQWAQLDTIAEQMLVPYADTKHIYAVIRGYVYKAIAAMHLDGMEKARDYLRRAIAMAEPDEVRIPFIENGVELQPVMEGMEYRGSFFASLKPLMRHYQKSLKQFQREEPRVVLTKREEELMSLVKAGFRNMEISEKLNIALVTVEKNLTAIYRKLNVSNRAAAIARMEEL